MFNSKKHYLSICNSAPSEVLALIALRQKETILNNNLKILLKNIALIDSFLLRWHLLFEWVRPKGGVCGLMLYKGINGLPNFAEYILNKFGILIIPGDKFSVGSKDISNHFRFGFGRLNFEECLKILENAIIDFENSLSCK
jgi:aspartate/methionine/tyrosine aminotransferase